MILTSKSSGYSILKEISKGALDPESIVLLICLDRYNPKPYFHASFNAVTPVKPFKVQIFIHKYKITKYMYI